MSMHPQNGTRRSPIYREFTGASFVDVAGVAVAASRGTDPNQSQAKKAGLLDLSALPRTGVRGTAAAEHLAAHNLPIPEHPNMCSLTAQGDMVLRLSQREFWLLGHPVSGQQTVSGFKQHTLPEKGCYSLFCQDSHVWFAMTGMHLPDIMAKLCGVDLQETDFPVGAIAQTSVARINAIIINQPLNSIPCFSILCDSSAAEYMWHSLLDAMAEFEGQWVGYNDVFNEEK